MIVAPAVDILGGRCVQLVGGRPEEQRVSLPRPTAVAERWWELGFGTLHIVDLDAAMGSGDNFELLVELISATPASKQVSGGIRDDARAEALLEAGADRVVIGTRALDDPEWLSELALRHPGRVMVAADTRDGYVLRKGWTETSTIPAVGFLAGLAGLPLAGILATDVDREGRLQGIDRDNVAVTLLASPHPVWIAGGVTTELELSWLDATGASGAVLGMALYTETLQPKDVARRWGGLDHPREGR